MITLFSNLYLWRKVGWLVVFVSFCLWSWDLSNLNDLQVAALLIFLESPWWVAMNQGGFVIFHVSTYCPRILDIEQLLNNLYMKILGTFFFLFCDHILTLPNCAQPSTTLLVPMKSPWWKVHIVDVSQILDQQIKFSYFI